MKYHSFYVLKSDGLCLFDASFSTMPPAAIITGMLSAMQAFIHEVSGSYAKKLSAGDFVFHLERVGRMSFVLATTDDERPTEQLKQLSLRFLHKYGRELGEWRGSIDIFDLFMADVEEILDIVGMGPRINPTQPLSSFVLIKLPPELQEIARKLIMKKEITAEELAAENSEKTAFQIRLELEKLLEMGHVGRFEQNNVFHYFTQ